MGQIVSALYRQLVPRLSIRAGPLPGPQSGPCMAADVVRGHRPRRLPVVLTEKEVRIVLDNLQGTPALVAQILYGSGLRLMEALCLRIKDVDFEKNSIVVRDGKGNKDRITMLPESLKVSLQAHLTNVFALHQKDLSAGWGRVELPDALARKYVNAAKEWGWQWVFPQQHRWRN